MAYGATYVWNFDAGNLAITPGSSDGSMEYRGNTEPLTAYEITGGVYPHINGQPARYLRHDAWPTPAANDITLGYDLTFNESVANGGGIYINEYSFVIDLLIPNEIAYVPLFQTNIDNENDADWYVAPDGSFGIGQLGYTTAGLISPNTWYRLGFAANLAINDIRYYLNGTLVFTSGNNEDLIDGSFSIFSNADDGPDLLLFNENDPGGNYSHAALYNSIAFFDHALSTAEMNLLGPVSAAGIPIPEPSSALLLSALFLVGAASYRPRNHPVTHGNCIVS